MHCSQRQRSVRVKPISYDSCKNTSESARERHRLSIKCSGLSMDHGSVDSFLAARAVRTVAAASQPHVAGALSVLGW